MFLWVFKKCGSRSFSSHSPKEAEINTVDTLDLGEVFVSETVLNSIVSKKKIDPDTSFQISPTKKMSEKVVSKCNPILQFQVTRALSQFIQNQPRIQAEQSIFLTVTQFLMSRQTQLILFVFLFPDGSTVPITIEGFEFRCLVDTGAAVTAASANVWTEFLRHVCVDDSYLENITSVNGIIPDSLGKHSYNLSRYCTKNAYKHWWRLLTVLGHPWKWYTIWSY